MSSYIDKLHAVDRTCTNQGYLTELQYDASFSKDSDHDNNVRELKFTDHQYHLMRSIAPYHFYFRTIEITRRNKLIKKRKKT